MKLDRLARMSLDEVACRARQRLTRWVDEAYPAFAPSGVSRAPWLGAGPIREGRARAMLRSLGHRFFEGATDVRWLEAEGPRTIWRQDLIDRAEASLAGCFDLLGYRRLSFGTPIDWHLDPVTGRRAPRVHWARINPLDAAVVGDSKVIWEINRHQWMVTLAQAYRISGDDRFAEAVMTHLGDWTEQNPYPVGINWASSLEVALRLIAWCWTIAILRDAPALTDRRLAAWLTLLAAHARHVERYLSYYYSPNTHLTGEALGLVYAGIVLAGEPDASRWRDLGRRVLVAELERQVGADGVHFEQATCYQRYTADIYLHLLALARRNGLAVPCDMPRRIGVVVGALRTLAFADGSVPQIGDADGGWLLPLHHRAASDCRGTFALAASMLKDPASAWLAGSATPEVGWYCGLDGVRSFANIGVSPPAEGAAVLPSGYIVVRSHGLADAHQIILDAGPLGCPVSAGHGHADLLSVHCVVFGEPFIVDPGTYCYTSEPMWRAHFRGTDAHSTITVDGMPQADAAGPFSWHTRVAATPRACELESTHQLLDASYVRRQPHARPMRHRRRVICLDRLGWVLIDDVDAAGCHTVQTRFQFSPRRVEAAADGWVRAEGRRRSALWVRISASSALTCSICEGQEDPIAGWVSPAYGVRLPAPLLVAQANFTDRMRLVTTFVPERPARSSPPAVSVEIADDGTAVVRFDDDPRVISVVGEHLTVVDTSDRQRTA